MIIAPPYNTVSAPPTVSLEPVSPTSARITWSYQLEAHSYVVSYAYAGVCLTVDHSGSVTADGDVTEYTLTGLEEYSTYTITVRAVNDAGISNPTTVQASTLTIGMFAECVL